MSNGRSAEGSQQSTLIKDWQGRASKRRENDAWRAGVATADGTNEPQYERETTKRISETGSDKRESMRASQIRTSDENVVLRYHAPIPKVQFQCLIQKSRKSNIKNKNMNKIEFCS